MLDHAKELEREGVASYMCHVGNLGGPAEMALFENVGMLPRAVTVFALPQSNKVTSFFAAIRFGWHVVMKDFRRLCLQ